MEPLEPIRARKGLEIDSFGSVSTLNRYRYRPSVHPCIVKRTHTKRTGHRSAPVVSVGVPAAAVHSPFPRSRASSISPSQLSCSSPGLISRLSSVAIPVGSSHEYPTGRKSTYIKLRVQLPCEYGFGGAGPGTSVLCAATRIYVDTRDTLIHTREFYSRRGWQRGGVGGTIKFRLLTCSIVVTFRSKSYQTMGESPYHSE